jgi:hypothetical protein
MSKRPQSSVSIVMPFDAQRRAVPVQPFLVKASPFSNALRRLNYLHRIAIGEIRSKKHTQNAAADRYRRMLIGFFSQSMLATPGALLQGLGRACDIVASLGSLDGVESVFLTLLFASRTMGESPAVQRAIRLCEKLRVLPAIGGGADIVLVADTRTMSLTYLTLNELHQFATDLHRSIAISGERRHG